MNADGGKGIDKRMPEEFSVIGKSKLRIDARDKV